MNAHALTPNTHTHMSVTKTQNNGDSIIIDLTGRITLESPLVFNGQKVTKI